MAMYQVCSLCGTALTGQHKYILLKDENDIYEKYHSKRFELCESCVKEIYDKAEKIEEALKKNLSLDDKTVGVMVELDE